MNMQRPKGDTYYNERADNYEKRRKKQGWWHVEQEHMQALLDMLPRGLSVVDIPFGTGRFGPYYAERGYKISGLDSSGHRIDAARRALGGLFDDCHCSIGDAARLPFEDEKFDLLVSTRFLRDIVTYDVAKRALAEFSRVTKKYAIIQLGQNPNGDTPLTDADVMAGKMSEEKVTQLLADNKLRVTERRLVKDDEEGHIYHLLCEKT